MNTGVMGLCTRRSCPTTCSSSLRGQQSSQLRRVCTIASPRECFHRRSLDTALLSCCTPRGASCAALAQYRPQTPRKPRCSALRLVWTYGVSSLHLRLLGVQSLDFSVWPPSAGYGSLPGRKRCSKGTLNERIAGLLAVAAEHSACCFACTGTVCHLCMISPASMTG
jgi:hypothetical protein